jgi:hypothetical protein
LQPPVKDVVDSQAENAALTSLWVEQADKVKSSAQLRTTGGGAVTVKSALQVTSSSQSLSTVHTTVVVPPQAGGGPTLLFVITALQPPVKNVVDSQAENAASTSLWVGQADKIRSSAQFRTTG